MKLFIQTCILVTLLFASHKSFTQDKAYFIACVAYYNLENLFDTIDSPDTRDTEFTPQGKSGWNTTRYLKKLNNLAQVISQIGTDVNPDGLAVLGFSEVENRQVTEDLMNHALLGTNNFQIIHYESPDYRGIDVGLVYNPKYFQPTSTQAIPLLIPEEEDFKSRDQLLVSGKMAGEEVHFIVMHWPSRRGGEKRSKPFRIAAAQLCRSISDSLLQINPEAKIVLMGDFNDNPRDESIKKHLQTIGNINKVNTKAFYNPMEDIYKKGIGTTAWRDSWSLFDQIMVSGSLAGKQYNTLKLYKTFVFNKTFLEQPDGRYKGYPWRTSAGGVYLGGYSDHFPVYIYLIKEI